MVIRLRTVRPGPAVSALHDQHGRFRVGSDGPASLERFEKMSRCSVRNVRSPLGTLPWFLRVLRDRGQWWPIPLHSPPPGERLILSPCFSKSGGITTHSTKSLQVPRLLGHPLRDRTGAHGRGLGRQVVSVTLSGHLLFLL